MNNGLESDTEGAAGTTDDMVSQTDRFAVAKPRAPPNIPRTIRLNPAQRLLVEGQSILRKLHKLCMLTFPKALEDTLLLTPEFVEPVVALTSMLRLGHFGLQNARLRQGIGYLHLVEEEYFSAGLFILSPGAVIPLHDHPEMCVISNILQGSVHIKSFDWANHSEDHSNGGLATQVCNQTYNSPATKVLFPQSGGNIHTFQADKEHGCVILDVLAPPYNDDGGRTCSYYKVDKFISENAKVSDLPLAQLGSFDPGMDFEIVGIPYQGPPMLS